MSGLPLLQWIPLETASLFKIISQFTLSPKANKRPIHRLCSLMRRSGAQSLWIEEIFPETDVELQVEINCLTRFLPNLETSAYKFYFVLQKVVDSDYVNIKKMTFLSCSVVINYSSGNQRDSYLLYSIVATPKKYNYIGSNHIPLMNHYLHSTKEYKLSFKGKDKQSIEFTLRGAPFFQKNNVTSYCIQSSLATMLNHMTNSEKLILPNTINELLNLSDQEIEGGGLTIEQTKQVIKKLNLHYKTFDFHESNTENIFTKLHKYNDWPPASLIYPWMESSLPGFIIFTTFGKNKEEVLHVVPIIGHTLNCDVWQPEADIYYKREVQFNFRPVSAWVDNFIIHDDNFGMYFSYPTCKLGEKKRGHGYLVNYVLFVTEKEIKSKPDKIEITLMRFIRNLSNKLRKSNSISEKKNPWMHRIVNEIKAPFVSRTLLVKKQEYIKCFKIPDFENNYIPQDLVDKIESRLPPDFWLTEITLPDLYIANKSILISFISDINTEEPIFFRFPQIFGLVNKKNQFDTWKIPTTSHHKLFQKKNDPDSFDW